MSESTHSLRRMVPVACSIALACRKLVGLSPFVRGRVSVCRGYNPCFGRAEAPKAPPRHCLSFGQDLDGDLLFSDLEFVNKPITHECVLVGHLLRTCMVRERILGHLFACMPFMPPLTTLYCIQPLTSLLFCRKVRDPLPGL